ncbi:type II toxin-antitoxin system Phd/YefM family antitoxin [Puniceicoccales bacterium CK1056]|uniref:Antitoxin n=1 Tax=Oceanipulchritudo coccoides TaxID=2706888 RepID=A0A6B2M117_9BACT|nr:type II toxin-antitoxin system prevent-host-death family antitoxin [Oceanipulchritudo coccoides]NDV62056.1 type II toxin-antitoxin system Phd/YefM family antitoxin [Oceanipulchritudo coccoides]
MKHTYNIHEAKTHLSKLVEEAAVGEEIIIAKSGKPKAKLVPYADEPRREPGRYKANIQLSATFFDPLPVEELRAWEGTSK